MVLWTSDEAQQATGGTSTAPWRATGVSIDTRTLQPGDLFIALQGDASDGHAYVEEAFRKGAAAALVSQGINTDKPFLKVDDTLKGLEDLGRFAQKRASKAKRIAVTGSVGKTSTKEMIKLALSTQGLTHASVASYNNHWGVPLTLARMPQNTDYAVFEIGMNHSGEITPLTKMVKPHVAIITTVAASHLGNFESIQDIARAKSEILHGLDEQGVAILNFDNAYFKNLKEWAQERGIRNILSFGHSEDCDAKLIDANHQMQLGDALYELSVADHGPHLGQNAAAVLLAVKAVGADVAEGNANLAHFQQVEGRGDVHRIEHLDVTLINESYNANPTSMEAAFKVLGGYEGRKIAVIGDMRELGPDADQLHEGLLEPLQANGIDKVYCCGPHMATLYEKLPTEMKAGYTEASTDLIPLVKSNLLPGDVVMVKGSLGTRMKPIVEALLDLNNEDSKRAVN